MSLRKEVQELESLSERTESPLDPAVYEDNDDPIQSSSTLSLSSSSSSSSNADAIFPFTLNLKGLKGDKPKLFDQSCSLRNIYSVIIRAILESIFFAVFFLAPAILAYFATESSWYNIFTQRWNDQYAVFSNVMEFVRVSLHVAVLYSLWVIVDAATRIVPLIIRRSWLLLNIPLPNAVKSALGGWKAARKSINMALFGFIGLLLTDILVFGSSKLVSTVAEMTSSTFGGISKASQWTEMFLISAVSLSILMLGKKILIQWITTAYRKQALAPRILSSNFKFRVLTRLFRQTNLGEIDARRSIARERAREALHPNDEDFIEISKDIAGIHLTSQDRAELIARALWSRVCPFSREYIVLEDFRPFFTAEDSPEAFSVFDINNTGIVNERAWTDAVTGIWSERRNLQSSVKMSDSALSNFETIIDILVLVGWLMSVLGCFSPSGYAYLSASFGFVFGFGFLFKESCERVFKSFIFVLVEHPYDIGDTVIIDKIRYDVMEMQVFQTVFKRISDSTITYMSNNVLLSKYIYNEQRSGLITESLLVTLPARTSISILGSLQARLNVFLSETFSTYTGSIKINPIEVHEGKMNIRIECKFKDSISIEREVKVARKDSLSQQIQTYLRENGISI